MSSLRQRVFRQRSFLPLTTGDLIGVMRQFSDSAKRLSTDGGPRSADFFPPPRSAPTLRRTHLKKREKNLLPVLYCSVDTADFETVFGIEDLQFFLAAAALEQIAWTHLTFARPVIGPDLGLAELAGIVEPIFALQDFHVLCSKQPRLPDRSASLTSSNL